MVFEGVAVTLLILLAFLMLAMLMGSMESNSSAVAGNAIYTSVGPDNMLYIFSTDNNEYAIDHIQAIDSSGKQVWSFSIPSGSALSQDCMPLYFYSDGSYSYSDLEPSVAAGNGVLYVSLMPSYVPVNSRSMNVTLMAISDQGQVLWTKPIDSLAIPDPGLSNPFDGDVAIKASGDRVYVFHDFNETVLDSNGTVLWNVANISDPAVVDENGYLYMVKSRPAVPNNYLAYNTPETWIPQPSSTIDAYYPNGTLYWENNTDDPIQDQDQTYYYYFTQISGLHTMPIYYGGLLYAPTESGISVFYPNGTVKWEKSFTQDELNLNLSAGIGQKPGTIPGQETTTHLTLYYLMPFDSDGNVYMVNQNEFTFPQDHKVLMLTLNSTGALVSRQDISNSTAYYSYTSNGVGYNFDTQGTGNITGLTDLQGGTLHAYDIKSGNGLWSYNISVADMNVVTLNLANVRAILGDAAEEAIDHYELNISYAGVEPTIDSGSSSNIMCGNGTVYLNFQSYNYEYPVVFGKSQAAYAGGIYAFADNGSLLWYKSVRAQDFMQVTQNGTIFYQTPDGKIGVTSSGIVAAGFTLTALVYLFLRFFCVGAVARAKARLNKNGNRILIMDFVIINPGCTLYEIARGTGVNLGTVRYHLFILGMNHKIVASSIDGKYIRYFTNSNSYSPQQQLVISLLRRDTVGKILGLLDRRPGISNVEIAGEVGIPESITSRYLKELSEKGVVKNLSSGRERAYSIDEAYRGHVADALKRLKAI